MLRKFTFILREEQNELIFGLEKGEMSGLEKNGIMRSFVKCCNCDQIRGKS
jgi:hypothetical protein